MNKVNEMPRYIYALLFTLILCLQTVLAGSGDGTGKGTGEGKDKAGAKIGTSLKNTSKSQNCRDTVVVQVDDKPIETINTTDFLNRYKITTIPGKKAGSRKKAVSLATIFASHLDTVAIRLVACGGRVRSLDSDIDRDGHWPRHFLSVNMKGNIKYVTLMENGQVSPVMKRIHKIILSPDY